MLTIKENLYFRCRIALHTVLLLPWLLSQSTLQGAQPTGGSAQEEPIIQSIWENQIDPALGWNAVPFSHSFDPNNIMQPNISNWSATFTNFGAHNTLFTYNGFINNPSIDMAAPLIHMGNPVESPFYYGAAHVNGSLPGQSPFPYAASISSIPSLPSNKPISSGQTAISKEQPNAIAHAKSPADKNKICLYCGKKFKKTGNLNAHIRIHTGEKPFECNYCQKRFAEKSNLKRHLRVHTGEKPFKCNYCDKAFGHWSTLQKHVQKHTNENSFECSYCNKSFTLKGNLTIHIRTHTNDKPYGCSYCDKRFTQQSTLKTHLRTHTNEKPYKCSYCKKSFPIKGNLTIHLRTHTNEKPYACSYCHKRFAHNSNLTTHIRIHTKEKPYACTYCLKKFTRKGNLKRHTKSQHT